MSFLANGRHSFALSVYLMEAAYRNVETFTQLEILVELVACISRLIHELQRERGSSSLFLGSRGAQFGAELERQVQRTALPERNLLDRFATLDPMTLGPRLLCATQNAHAALSTLPDLRAQVRSLALPARASSEAFTRLIIALLTIVSEAAEMSSDRSVTHALIAYFNFIQGKEYAGQERALGSVGFAAGRFDVDQHRRFLALGAEQERLFAVFRKFSTEQQVTFADETMGAADIEDMRSVVRKIGLKGGFDDIKAPIWFERASRRIDAMWSIEERLAADLRERCATAKATALANFHSDFGCSDVLPRLTLRFARRRQLRRIAADQRRTAVVRRLIGADIDARSPPIVRAARDMLDRLREVKTFASEQQDEDQNRLHRHQALEELIYGFGASSDEALGTMLSAVDIVLGRAKELLEISSITDDSCAEVAGMARQSAMSMELLAKSAGEFATTIAAISTHTDEVLATTQASEREAEITNQLVGGLTDAAQRIGDVIDVIDRIANKTNLLALNAMIEATRAGESGKGFAVVAGEVKALSQQTAIATEEISGQVNAIRSSVENAVGAITGIHDTVARMGPMIVAIAGELRQQEIATQRITSIMEQVSVRANTTETATAKVAVVSGDTRDLATQMSRAAHALHEQADALQRHIEGFIVEVRRGVKG